MSDRSMTGARPLPAVYQPFLGMVVACLFALPQVVLASKAPTGAVPETPAEVTAEAVDPLAYRIQPGDILQVLVWNEKDLQAEVLVRPDGGISFPLAGDLKASGNTIAGLAVDLTGRISKYIPDPVVTVAVKAINGNRIYVVGKVNHPGEFPAGRPIDVMQALALAGGTTPYAAVSDIRILRREGNRQTALRFDYTEVEKGRALDSNVLLKAGDTVVIP